MHLRLYKRNERTDALVILKS